MKIGNLSAFYTLLLLGVFASASSAADKVVDETFDAMPSSSTWIHHNASVQEGNLLLQIEGDADGYTNSMLYPSAPLEKLNFQKKKITITLDSLNLEGTAPVAARAFVIVLAAGKGGEADAAAYVRFLINGDGTVQLALSSGKDESLGTNLEKALVKLQVKFPLKRAVLTLDKDGYSLEVTDSSRTHREKGRWGKDLDEKIWEKEDPRLMVKAVCRPALGNVKVTLAGLLIEAD